MDKYKRVKSEYYAEYYKNHREEALDAKARYWYNKTCNMLHKEYVTDEEVRECQNQYYREYRAKNADKVKAARDAFWERKRKAKEEDK